MNKRSLLIMMAITVFFVMINSNVFGQNIDSSLVVYFPFNGIENYGIYNSDKSVFADVYGEVEAVDGFNGGVDGAIMFNDEEDVISTYADGFTEELPLGLVEKSVSFWAKLPEELPGETMYMVNYGTTVNGQHFHISYNSKNASHTLKMGHWGWDSQVECGELNDDTWHHFVSVYKGSVMKLYIDGILKGEKGFSGSGTANIVETNIDTNQGNNFYIGRKNDEESSSPHPCTGVSMDELRIYTRSLTFEDVQALFEFIPEVKTGNLNIKQTNVSAYPNPLKDRLIINSSNEIENVKLIDIRGKIVLESTSSNIDVTTLNNGIYILKVVTAEGIALSKVTKQ